MVDPNKLMLLTPGIDRKTGEYLDFGVPATVLANYLREQRIVPEKCDLNSILFLMTPAEDESKLNTLIAKLVKFKNLWDRDAPLGEALPTLYAQNSARYAGYTLRQVCKEMHDFYRKANVKELQKLCFRASELSRARDVVEGRLRGAGRERSGLRAARREHQGPRRRDARADLSAGHRRASCPASAGTTARSRCSTTFSTFEESFNRFPASTTKCRACTRSRWTVASSFHTYVVRE